MSTPIAADESFQRILEGHRKGYRDLLQTVERLSYLYASLPPNEQQDLLHQLLALMRTASMETKTVGGILVNEAVLGLVCLGAFGPTKFLPEFLFSRLNSATEPEMEAWARELCPQFQYLLMRYADRFDNDALAYIKACRTLVRESNRAYPLSVIQVLNQLERSADYMEYERFEKSLPSLEQRVPADESRAAPFEDVGLDPKIAEALEKAHQSLQTKENFSAKTAADLLRAAIDEAHRGMVDKLEALTGESCQEKAKDGGRRAYMRRAGFISEPEEKFFSSIYTLISEEASHKLDAPRETILLLHQTVGSYLFLMVERLRRRLAASHKVAIP
jgi:hypothetical protein